MKFMVESRQLVKYIFVFVAVAIAITSLLLSNSLVNKLAAEERNKIEIWAMATESLATGDENTDMSLVLQILQSNNTIPVILYDKTSGTFTANNIELPQIDTDAFLRKKMEEFAKKRTPILLEELDQVLYYDDSYILKQLQVYPYVQLIVISIFIALAFFALSSSQKAQQNKVWVGLSKETAHQLGTPISSLVAWTEYLKLKNVDAALLEEIDKDIHRLEMIAERFSKIGSVSDIKPLPLQDVVKRSLAYLEKRISNKVELYFNFPPSASFVMLNEPLFAWVIENLTKNAVDAMSGQGVITYSIHEKGKYYCLDVADSGKGMPKSKFKSVFMPGYTTKERGWGLGLSLAKRIIETYHGGKIFVKSSEMGKGTTFRVLLKSAK